MPSFHLFPLGVNVQRQGTCHSFARLQFLPPGKDESKSGYPLDALVRAANQEINAQAPDVDGNPSKAAHGIHNPGNAPSPQDFGNAFNGVQQARGRLAVYHGKVGNARMLVQCPLHNFRRDQLRFFQRYQHIIQVIVIGNGRHAFPIRPVGNNQELVFRTNRRAQGGFHPIRATSLKKDRSIFFLIQTGNFQQLPANHRDHPFVVILVPGTPIL